MPSPASGDESDFEFESSVRGEDTNVTYGTVLWGFGTRGGTVVNEHISFSAGTSATFDDAIERHRDFYVHEPVTIYFAFDRDNVDAIQNAKITELAGHLSRNPHADPRQATALHLRLGRTRVHPEATVTRTVDEAVADLSSPDAIVRDQTIALLGKRRTVREGRALMARAGKRQRAPDHVVVAGMTSVYTSAHEGMCARRARGV